MKRLCIFFLVVSVFAASGCAAHANGNRDSGTSGTSADNAAVHPGVMTLPSLFIPGEKPDKSPFTLCGTVTVYETGKGTFSSIRYYTLVTEDQSEYYLFNAKGKSAGFDRYVGIFCSVTGEWGEGEIGFRGAETEGVFVQAMAPADKQDEE